MISEQIQLQIQDFGWIFVQPKSTIFLDFIDPARAPKSDPVGATGKSSWYGTIKNPIPTHTAGNDARIDNLLAGPGQPCGPCRSEIATSEDFRRFPKISEDFRRFLSDFRDFSTTVMMRASIIFVAMMLQRTRINFLTGPGQPCGPWRSGVVTSKDFRRFPTISEDFVGFLQFLQDRHVERLISR